MNASPMHTTCMYAAVCSCVHTTCVLQCAVVCTQTPAGLLSLHPHHTHLHEMQRPVPGPKASLAGERLHRDNTNTKRDSAKEKRERERKEQTHASPIASQYGVEWSGGEEEGTADRSNCASHHANLTGFASRGKLHLPFHRNYQRLSTNLCRHTNIPHITAITSYTRAKTRTQGAYI